MIKEWFTANEIAGKTDMPTTPRRVRARAEKDGWKFRKRAKGKGLEYHLSSLPISTQIVLVGNLGSHVDPAGDDPSKPLPQSKSSPAFSYNRESLWQWFDKKPERQKAEARRKLQLLNMVMRLFENGTNLNDAFKAVGDQSGVSWRTIQGWYHGKNGKPGAKHYDRTDWLAAMVPQYQGRVVEAAFDDAAWDMIRADYLRPEKPTISACYHRLERAASEHGWSIPSIKTVTRKLQHIPRTVQVLKRDGESALVALYPAQERTVRDLHALQWINGDGYQHNVFVKWPGEANPVRPKTWFWQDIYSRKIIAYRVDLSENTDSIRLSFGDVVEDYGIPEHVVIDNTRAAANKWMTGGVKNRYRFKVKEDDPIGLIPALCGGNDRLHWTSVIAGKGHGQAKPVERAFGVGGIGEYVDKHPNFDGAYTGANPTAKPENYASKAVDRKLFLKTLEQEIIAWNAKGKRRTEICAGTLSFDQAFDQSYATAPIQKATEEQRRLWMLSAEAIRIQKDGAFTLDAGSAVGVGRNRYSAPELLDFAGQKMVIRFDPQQLHEQVHVYTLDNRYVCRAVCIDATGFGDSQAAREHTKHRTRMVKATKIAAKAQTRMSTLEVGEKMPQIAAQAPIDAKVVRPVFPSPAKGRPTPQPELSESQVEYINEFQKSFSTTAPVDVVEDGPHERWERYNALVDKRAKGEHLAGDELQFLRMYPKGNEYRSMRDFYADFDLEVGDL